VKWTLLPECWMAVTCPKASMIPVNMLQFTIAGFTIYDCWQYAKDDSKATISLSKPQRGEIRQRWATPIAT
jgi:hypothetical protein